MNVADEIGKLHKLKAEGALTEAEFEKAKSDLLAKNNSAGSQIKSALNEVSSDENTWGMLIHLSQFCGYIIPLAGLIVPVVLWQIKKDESKVIDQHGRNVANWMISAFIYGIVSFILSGILIGIPMLIAVAIMTIVFPIIGGIKANNAEIWAYPLSIKFFKSEPSLSPPAATPPPPPGGFGAAPGN